MVPTDNGFYLALPQPETLGVVTPHSSHCHAFQVRKYNPTADSSRWPERTSPRLRRRQRGEDALRLNGWASGMYRALGTASLYTLPGYETARLCRADG